VVEHRRRYGYRRVAAALRRRGMPVNHKRVVRLMRADNLLAVQPQTFAKLYLNLARRMNLRGINQLWVADVTLLRLHSEFVDLAVILDAFSRKVVDWGVEPRSDGTPGGRGVGEGIAERRPAPGSSTPLRARRAVASGEYIGILNRHQMRPSMSRPANPHDNRRPQRQAFVVGVERQ
jgi:putative transposase